MKRWMIGFMMHADPHDRLPQLALPSTVLAHISWDVLYMDGQTRAY